MQGPKALEVKHYHVFLASPGDVEDERKAVGAFFESYSRIHGTSRGLSFDVVDWENYSTAGVGRPQELITRQTLERFRESLVLVIGIMDQRLGSCPWRKIHLAIESASYAGSCRGVKTTLRLLPQDPPKNVKTFKLTL